MRARRIYVRVALGGLVFLILVTALLRAVGAPAAWGFSIVAVLWLGLALAVGLILAVARYGR